MIERKNYGRKGRLTMLGILASSWWMGTALAQDDEGAGNGVTISEPYRHLEKMIDPP